VLKQKETIITGFMIAGITILILLLMSEYYFFMREGRRLRQLRAQYRTYINTIRHYMRNNNISEDVDDSDQLLYSNDAQIISRNQVDDMCVVNRDVAYLKESMHAYLKEQNLDGLMQRLQGEDWFAPAPEPQVSKPKIAAKTARHMRTIPQRKKSMRRYYDIEFDWPIERSRFWISSFFGSRKNPDGSIGFHNGIDMASIRGTPVQAAAPGRVLEAHYVSGYGNTVLIQHNRKYKTRYAHLNSIAVKKGQAVSRSVLVGTVGDTGFVRKVGKDASHLHFEVYAFSKRINPLYFLA